jgi:hypothetical protein
MQLLWYLVCSFACFPDPPAGKVEFAKCGGTKLHVSIAIENDSTYLVHTHLLVTQMAGRKAFARMRVQTLDPDGKPLQLHDSVKELPILKSREQWSLFFPVPRVTEPGRAIYQLEIGEYDHTQLNDFDLMDVFAWRIKGGTFVKADETIPHFVRIIDPETKEFRVVSKRTVTAPEPLTFGLAPKVDRPSSGRATAERLGEGK